ncbi:MAG: hypothetical protein N0E58_00005 [Candidatus Thiodiazotropha endolucinida]|uniref:Carboxypeptidase regulatory-like domain-containing protein n=1 Tax=Candidatus Thiodiazotropha taylori TaxID=2792791 RepID=A0A9E4NGF2_9GAMM|nr:hypothetical protein [Candidatus Thiodiazotropha sp. (ex Codakia orbicularis)]MCG7976514.1 hypothetical protein [Candidatus Thiodiazotropha taylori]MCW4234631.1 hypothetical protein [Candidatus Thiodiazotropha endolucinida]
MKYLSFLIIALSLSIQGCSVSGIKGAVIDKTTRKPVKNVEIIASWDKRVAHVSGSNHIEVAKVTRVTSDDNGKFVIPDWFHLPNMPFVYIAEPTIHVKKNGYLPIEFDMGIINDTLTFYDGRVVINNESMQFGKKHPAVGSAIKGLQEWMENLDEPEYSYRHTRTYNENTKRMEVTKIEKITNSKYDQLDNKRYKLRLFQTYYNGIFELESN